MKTAEFRLCRVAIKNCGWIPDRDRGLIEERFMCALESILDGPDNVLEAWTSGRGSHFNDARSQEKWTTAVCSARSFALRTYPNASTAYFDIMPVEAGKPE